MHAQKLMLTVGLALMPTLAHAEPSTDVVKGKPALLVIDIQNAYLGYMDEQEAALGLEMINHVIGLFRAQGFPVIRVYHTDPQHGPAQDSKEYAFPDTVPVTQDDPQVVKNYPSAFKKTELEKLLGELGCDTVFLCGLSSVGCVLATYYDAVGLELTTFMVKDAVISHRPDLTTAVEEITGAVDYRAIEYMLANAPR